ncbi:hypothetical protein ACLGIH_30355 [Streptomyces sp. HMX87]|uniref:hypothetical protein n=1 Tax=Streptomyces sp. HMX87 TaxID=3390849 RepID=UPI003A8A1DDD
MQAAPRDARHTLVSSAGMGAGDDTVAAELTRRAREHGDEARVVDVLCWSRSRAPARTWCPSSTSAPG